MLAGDESAFETFFETSFPPLFRFSLSRVRDPELAREFAQTTICKAIANLPKYRGDAPLTAWLFTICRNEISAHFRRLGKNPAPVELLEEAPEVRLALGRIAAGVDSPEQALHRKEVSQQIHGILDQLPPRYGQVLEWKYIDGLSVKEIAAHLELGPKAAESLLTRARVAFKEAYLALGQSKRPNITMRSKHWSAALLSFAWSA
jgi:RNA polymerase sigma-70 factor (ECF subfamily)